MGNDTITNRNALLRAATLVKPALSDRSFVPALTHVMLDGEWATAFNDRLAVAVLCDAAINRLVPGMLLIQGLSAFGSKEVVFNRDTDDSFVMKSGRSRLKLPTLPLKDFPFDWPDSADVPWIDFSEEMVKAVKRCLVSVNKDASQPAQMGVTFDVTGTGSAVFYSTDNYSISRAECRTKVDLPGDSPIIMPLAFCEQLIALAEAFPHCPPTMLIGGTWLEVQYASSSALGPEAKLFTRIPVDLDPMDFHKVVRRHVGELGTLDKRTATVPDAFDAALARALLVLGNETRKKATVRVSGGTLSMQAASEYGNSDDTLQIDLEDVGPVTLEAAFVARGLKHATRVGLTDTVTILLGGERSEFLHIVAHVRDMQ